MMADKGHQGHAHTDEERRRENANEGGHASHERGAAHEFNNHDAADALRRGAQHRVMAHAGQQPGGGSEGNESESKPDRGSAGGSGSEEESGGQSRGRKTRGGTHDQHVTAGKKGGSRIRQLIELGYKYEQEHGIGPGQNERSKLAAKRRSEKSGGADEE
jgi:hypothetical protein